MKTPKEKHTTNQAHEITSEQLKRYNHVIDSLIEPGDVQRVLEDTDYKPDNIEKELEENLETREYWQIARQILNSNILSQNQEIKKNGDKPNTTPYMDILDLYSHVRRIYPEHKLEEESLIHPRLTKEEIDSIPDADTVTGIEQAQWHLGEDYCVKITEPEQYASGTSSFHRLKDAYWKDVDIGEEETRFRYVGEIPVDEV